MIPQERIAFVDALKIKREAKRTIPRPQRLPTSVNNASAAVAGGTLFVFVDTVDKQTRGDVLDSMLLAELSADAQYSRSKETAEWYAHYSGVLKTVGWVTVKFDFDRVDNADQSGTVDALVIKLVSSFMSDEDLKLFKEAVASLKNNDGAQFVFDTKAKSGRAAGFVVGVIHQVIGKVTTTIGYYDYKTTAHIDHALFFTFSNTKVDFKYGNETVQFDTEIYAMVRESVRKQLGEEPGKWTETIDI